MRFGFAFIFFTMLSSPLAVAWAAAPSVELTVVNKSTIPLCGFYLKESEPGKAKFGNIGIDRGGDIAIGQSKTFPKQPAATYDVGMDVCDRGRSNASAFHKGAVAMQGRTTVILYEGKAPAHAAATGETVMMIALDRPEANSALVKIVNRTVHPICQILIAAPGEARQGDPDVGANAPTRERPLRPGGSALFRISKLGTFSARVITCKDEWILYTNDMELTESSRALEVILWDKKAPAESTYTAEFETLDMKVKVRPCPYKVISAEQSNPRCVNMEDPLERGACEAKFPPRTASTGRPEKLCDDLN